MITTQQIKNWLGGISSQPDDKKLKGQVRDALNCYPDPTFGLTKRPGTRFIDELGHEAIEGGKWFFIHRDGTEKYVGVVYDGKMRIWNALTGEEANLTYTDKYAHNYLNVTHHTHWDRDRDHFQFTTVQDLTYVTNSSKVVRRYKGIEGEGGIEGDEWYIDVLGAEFDQPYQICIKQGTETKCICMIFTQPEVPLPELEPIPEAEEPEAEEATTFANECKQGEGADQQGAHCTPETCKNFIWDCYPKSIKICAGGCYDAYASTHGCNGACPAGDLEYMWQVKKNNGNWSNLRDNWSRNVRYTFHAEDLEPGDQIQGRIKARCNDFPGGSVTLTGDEFTIRIKDCSPPEPPPTPECTDNNDCPDGECCEGGKCVPCPEPPTPSPQPPPETICNLDDPNCTTECGFERPECFEGDYLKDGCVVIETEVLNNQIIVDNLLCYLKMISEDSSIDLCYTVEETNFGIKIVSCDGSGSLEITAEGGLDGGALFAFTDTVGNVSVLPSRAFNGQIVRVKNSIDTADDLCVIFRTNNGESYGDGYWEETRCEGASPGFNNFDMPHGLWNIGPNRFKFGPIDWCNREVGDEITNPDPSFVCRTINSTFFFENRLGILSENFVCMSRFDDYHCFYRESIRLLLDTDPIDITANTTRPVNLRYSITEQQGMSIYSNSQQFLLYSAEAGTLTPRTVKIRAVSEYEQETNIEPVDTGKYNMFVNKGKPWAYTRLMGWQSNGADDSPTVVELSKIIDERVPNNIDELCSSEQNNLTFAYSQSSSEVWLYRSYSTGQKDLMNTWVRWCLPGDVQFMAVSNDMVMIVFNQACRTQLVVAQLVQSLDISRQFGPLVGQHSQLHMDSGFDVWPGQGIEYIAAEDETRIYTPYNVACCADGEEGRFITAPVLYGLPDGECKIECGEVHRGWSGRANERDYFAFEGDLTSGYQYLYAGLSFDFVVFLPTLFMEPEENKTDYTAVFTVARYLFSMGTTGMVEFWHQAYGRDMWKQIVPVIYQAPYVWNHDNCLTPRYIFNCPIHQRNEHFWFKVYSNSVWPIEMTSMTWEARYNPRWYKRS